MTTILSAVTLSLLLLSILEFAATSRGSVDKVETHSFGVRDLWAMERISNPQVSPDGTMAVFEKKSFDLDENKGTSNLWLARTDGTHLRPLTSHPAGSTHPRWAPDGKSVWLLSARSGSMQVWRIPIDGGEAEQFTHEPLEVGNLLVAPDGRHIAYTMEVFPSTTPAQTKERLDAAAIAKATGSVYESLFIRHWDSWNDGRRSHLFVRTIDAGDAVDVMKSLDCDVPSKPFGGSEEFAFVPGGGSVLFCASDTGRTAAWSTQRDLYLAPIDGSAGHRCLTEGNRACLTHPVFSPDGKTLAYLAMQRPGYEADRFRIVLKPWPDGSLRSLTENWDRSPSTIVWSSDGKTLYAVAGDSGQRSLFAVNADTGDVHTLVEQGHVSDPAVAADRVLFGLCHLRSPVELYSVSANGKENTGHETNEVWPVTAINSATLASIRMGEPQQFTFSGWNEEQVHGYVLKPADFQTGKRYPVAFLIHGGPQGSFGNDFHYRWNPQVYAGAGYAVVMIDFHGSTGYGQAFTDSIRDDWGGKPLVDLQKGLEAALAKYSWMDGERVAALGASYGGYMINWIAGNWPDRFRCLVNHDGNLCERIGYYDTEELWFPEWERRGTPWECPEAYEKHNPICYVGNWKTPMLVIHGANDFRVVDTQGISTFTALQRRGIPSKLLYFPDENHWVLKPANSIQWHETVLAWLDQWT